MSLPRPVLPGHFYLITRRCTQRQFLLRPDPATNNAFTYCLLDAVHKSGVDLLLSCAMSNHHHTVIFDRRGRYPEFVEHFHKMLARSQNALRRRCENFWSSEQVSVVRLVGREDVMERLVYTATNPVKDHLVERAHQWPGVNGFRALITGKSLRAVRPRHFFRAEGPTPDSIEMKLTIPPELGSATEVLEELERRVHDFERSVAIERQRTGRRVCGRRHVLHQSWRGRASSPEQRRDVRPRIAARNKWSRIEARVRDRAFIRAYAKARAAWLDGAFVEFPAGTYWLRRFANVPIAPVLSH